MTPFIKRELSPPMTASPVMFLHRQEGSMITNSFGVAKYFKRYNAKKVS
jgi:hypothetical protein